MTTPPLIALTLGDPAGIGPEIALAAARRPGPYRLLLLGPGVFRPDTVPVCAGTAGALGAVGERAWLDTGPSPELCTFEPGVPQESAGRAALAALARGAELAATGAVDALVSGPVSKVALHLAGERVEGQTELLARWSGAEHVTMLAVADRLRVAPLTRHVPLSDALRAVGTESVLDGLVRLDAGLRGLGFERPRLALAGLNPHAGENGLLGSEERDLLVPAVERARARGLRVEGPVPPDSVFLAAARGIHDAVLALYHDQAFIPAKLAAPGRALTVLLGLPYLRLSPAHGTAFDIAGRGVADPGNLLVTLEQAAEWAVARARTAARAARP